MADSLDDQAHERAERSHAAQRVPRATYRVQLRGDFGLTTVRDLLPYLRDLGVSDVYLSPLFKARADSSHGYDVVNHGVIEPAFGTLADFQSLANAAREQGLGILLDVVPNHMGINDAGNAWWTDVLERGEAAEHAPYFDIDWRPAAEHLHGKVLLPFLSEPFGEALESGKMRLLYERGKLVLGVGDKRYPVARATWPPAIAELIDRSPDDENAIERALYEFNGRPGEQRSFDQLEAVLDAQAYRLANWRVAADEINYRRFFDINDLAAIRVEDARVFEAVHRLVARFLAEGWVTGLRIDHPDGLYDPEGYFANLQDLYRQASGAATGDDIYVVAEKILSADELLPRDWDVSGTTGYDFLNHVSRLLVAPTGLATLRENYDRLTGEDATAADVAYESKRDVLVHSLASEVGTLAAQLTRIAKHHRASRDFTRPALGRALREVIASLPVYRTYVRPRGWEISEADFRHIAAAVRWAKRRNPGAPHAVFDFIGSVLRLETPPGLSQEQADERRQFVLKLQQVTGPAMAKGLEDTAFYRYYPLASLNEVGGELNGRPLDAADFHLLMTHRRDDWPHSMSASSTHDTKRGEDVRARLHVLSEVADEWIAAVERWQQMVCPLLADVDGDLAPDRNELYLLFQTLVGTWPVRSAVDERPEAYTDRIAAYMQKALREAKRHTSWMNPAAIYESTVTAFVRTLLLEDAGASFRGDVGAFAGRIAVAGFVNGLSQLVLKTALPGVPDFYQGGEYWDFHLVDPDNRQPVDFDHRRRTLEELQRRYARSPARLAAEMGGALADDRSKQFVAWRALATRAAHADAFTHGEYIPLATSGARAAHVFAFARKLGDAWIAAVVPLQIQCLLDEGGSPNWGDAIVELPAAVRRWRHEFTKEVVDPRGLVGDLLRPLPVALLTSEST